MVDERVGELGVASRAGVLSRAVPLVVQLVPGSGWWGGSGSDAVGEAVGSARGGGGVVGERSRLGASGGGNSPRCSRGEKAADDVHMSVLARQHQRRRPLAVLSSGGWMKGVVSGGWKSHRGARSSSGSRTTGAPPVGGGSNLESRVRALADQRIDSVDVAGRGCSEKSTRRHGEPSRSVGTSSLPLGKSAARISDIIRRLTREFLSS